MRWQLAHFLQTPVQTPVKDDPWERNLTDRRRHERFRINGRAFVYYENRGPKIAEITDISTGGIAFSYVGIDESINQELSLEVILPDSTRFMDKLPCKTVSDCQMDLDQDEGLGKRRCSVRFSDLTQDQQAKIASFIDDYCWRVPK
jgi:c-di-GMP-binding flagellar brake protein YcgR